MDLKKACMEARIDQLTKELKKERQKNKELENIIDELEKYMLERRLTDIDGRTMIYEILDKLNKLKGDNK
jgi:HEPN domain-containing protein